MTTYFDKSHPPVCTNTSDKQLIESMWEEGQELKRQLEKFTGGKLYAIVNNECMDGDSEFNTDCYVEYEEGMTLEDVKKAYAETEICQEYEHDIYAIKVAWIVNQYIMDILDSAEIECYNDSQGYTVTRMMKEMARNLCIKSLL